MFYAHVTFTPLLRLLRSVTHCRFSITVLCTWHISVLGSDDHFTSRGHRRPTINSCSIMTKRLSISSTWGNEIVIEMFHAFAENADSGIAQNVENGNYLVKIVVNMLLDVAEPLFGADIRTGNKIDKHNSNDVLRCAK